MDLLCLLQVNLMADFLPWELGILQKFTMSWELSSYGHIHWQTNLRFWQKFFSDVALPFITFLLSIWLTLPIWCAHQIHQYYLWFQSLLFIDILTSAPDWCGAYSLLCSTWNSFPFPLLTCFKISIAASWLPIPQDTTLFTSDLIYQYIIWHLIKGLLEN